MASVLYNIKLEVNSRLEIREIGTKGLTQVR